MAWYLKYFTTVGEQHDATSLDDLNEDVEDLISVEEQIPPAQTFRETLRILYRSDRYQVVVVCLVLLDAFFVLTELLIDLTVIKLEHDNTAPQVFRWLSMALLCFFMLELIAKIYAYSTELLRHKFEVFDGIVVLVSFTMDIAFLFYDASFDGMGFLILLRLWRVARIINGILLSVKTRAKLKMHRLKNINSEMAQEMSELRENLTELAQEVSELRGSISLLTEEKEKLQALLQENKIEF